MTWSTPSGDRVLTPAERKLFATAVGATVDISRCNAMILEEPMEMYPYGVGPFDRFNVQDKCNTLLEVSTDRMRMERETLEDPLPPLTW